MGTEGLNRTQLKYIAIIAMVIDHTAWGFVEFMTPLGITMHLIGRLTMPIMCFFIAEGYYHTHSRRKYLERLLLGAVISHVPHALASRWGSSGGIPASCGACFWDFWP